MSAPRFEPRAFDAAAIRDYQITIGLPLAGSASPGRFPLSTPAALTALWNAFAVGPRRGFGQNYFLRDDILAELLVPLHGDIIEIGAGHGLIAWLLTRQFARLNPPPDFRLTLVELDRFYALWLRELFADDKRVRVLEGDALDATLLPPTAPDIVIGNLPYSITSPLLRKICVDLRPRIAGYFMAQWEFGHKLMPAAGGAPTQFADRRFDSSLALYLHGFGSWRVARRLPASFYFPRPSVDSAWLEFTPHAPMGHGVDWPTVRPALEYLGRAFFWGRRKTLGHLARHSPFLADRPDWHKKLLAAPAGESPLRGLADRRPEELTLRQWTDLAAALSG